MRARPTVAKPLILFLDFDGTLVSIRRHPSLVSLPPARRRFLKQFSSRPGVRIVVISGRALPDLKQKASISGLYYVGNHGLQMEGPGIRYLHPAARNGRKVLAKIARAIQTAVRGIPGVWLENKQLSLSLHFRQASAAGKKQARIRFFKIVTPHAIAGRVRVTGGKQVLELRLPVDWNKGEAARWLLKRWIPRRSGSPVVMAAGDDQTDEDLFRAVPRSGISIFVGEKPAFTRARYRVNSCADLYRFLRELSAITT